MPKYTVTFTAVQEYNTEEQDWITSAEDAKQDAIDLFTSSHYFPVDFFTIEVTGGPTCSHGKTGPHEVPAINPYSGGNYDQPWPCQEWVSEKGLFVDPPRLK
jgi:hypothetical protein